MKYNVLFGNMRSLMSISTVFVVGCNLTAYEYILPAKLSGSKEIIVGLIMVLP